MTSRWRNTMSHHYFPFFRSRDADNLHELQRDWVVIVALGGAMVLVGLIALTYPVVATLTTVEVFGFLLLIGGGVEVASAIWTRKWGGFFQRLFCGLLYLFLGALIVERPGLGAAGYTLLLALFFVATGLFRIIFAVTQRLSGWGWVLLGGIVSLLLGMMIWRGLPDAAYWVIGTFIGIDLLFSGLSWVMLGLAARNLLLQGHSSTAASNSESGHGTT
jgi:uncharacterized membrane protein HdeD (DUF308 family)